MLLSLADKCSALHSGWGSYLSLAWIALDKRLAGFVDNHDSTEACEMGLLLFGSLKPILPES